MAFFFVIKTEIDFFSYIFSVCAEENVNDRKYLWAFYPCARIFTNIIVLNIFF